MSLGVGVKVVFIQVLLFPLFIFADELLFSDYLIKVKGENLTIKLQKNDLEVKRLDELDSYAAFLPVSNLSMVYSYDRSAEDAVDVINRGLAAGSDDVQYPDWSRSLSVSLPVFAGGTRIVSLKMRTLDEQISSLELENSYVAIEAEAAAAFISAYISQENLEVSKKGVLLAEENLKNAEIMLKAGTVTELDYLSFKLALENRIQQQNQDELELKKQIAGLNRLSAGRLSPEKLVVDVDVNVIVNKFKGQELAALVSQYQKEMMIKSPLIKKIERGILMSDYGKMMSLTGFMPAFTLSYTHSFGQATSPFGSAYSSGLPQFPSAEDNDVFMASFNWNLFNGFRNGIDYKKAKVQEVKSLLLLQEMERSQIYSLKSALISIVSSVRQREVAALSLEISKRAFEKTETEYRSGRVTYLNLLTSENDYLTAMKNMVFLKASIVNSYYQLKLLVGKESLE